MKPKGLSQYLKNPKAESLTIIYIKDGRRCWFQSTYVDRSKERFTVPVVFKLRRHILKIRIWSYIHTIPCHTTPYHTALFTKYYQGNEIYEDEMGGACSMGQILKVHAWFQSVNLKERHHLEDLDIDGKIILKLILKKWVVKTWTGFN